MAAIAPERPLQKLPTERMLQDLTPEQQDMHWALMELLGYESGAATDGGGLIETAERAQIAQEAATNVGIALPAGHEVAECHDCGLIFDAHQAYEAEGITRCAEHQHAWALANDDNYGRPDSTFESRWD
ncbi:hypothetical protein [Streptomyces javensis]|uniref:DksA C4-type domain-containing protein n=1 Tax=Streptomyces javensis TaxID=114698 RepID=A0ABS0RR34_9ACTN|nr:hypothetical protein [Streptomyces javensis]MBI0319909.1 hypothetical protein [Streptomyces javensis]